MRMSAQSALNPVLHRLIVFSDGELTSPLRTGIFCLTSKVQGKLLAGSKVVKNTSMVKGAGICSFKISTHTTEITPYNIPITAQITPNKATILLSFINQN
jgi:hypothetical protein